MESRRGRAAWLVAIGLALLASCQTPIQVGADFRRNFRFSSVQTYAWLPDPPGHAGDPVLHNDLIDERVRGAVDRKLQEMGYRRVAEKADIYVTYYLGLETQVNARMVSSTYHYAGGFLDRHSTNRAISQYERGTLLIDLLEPTTRRLVWRGTASARVRRQTDPAERDRKIDDAVDKTLAQFPPSGPQFRPAAAS